MHQTSIFIRAEWRYLAMLNFPVDPALLTARVPPGTELDFWNGQTYVSLVGFRFLNTWVMGIPIPFHRHFDEVNLRFYVRYRHATGWRRGVAFIKEIVPRRMIAFVARWLYNENYHYAPMQSSLVLPKEPNGCGSVRYSWWTGDQEHKIEGSFEGVPIYPDANSEESFITEHYWGYARQHKPRTMEYQVEHPPWRVWSLREARFQCDVARLYGPEFVEPLRKAPSSAFLAEGSPIIVREGRLLPDA